jgi:nitrate reductase gamma subunit
MTLAALVYIGLAIFVIGNLCRFVKIARMPAHIRWEIYPVPHGSRERQEYGGSYFEESEWWKKPEKSNPIDELVYILKEVLLMKGVWENHRALWFWSWLFHLGLYSFVGTVVLNIAAAVTAHFEMAIAGTLASFVAPLYWIAAIFGSIGTIGVLILRASCSRLRPYTSRGTVINLTLIAAMFVTALLGLISEPNMAAAMTSFIGSLLGLGAAVQLPTFASAHVVIVALFLLYFPFTHMTHAYMKFFTYHSVRWEDVPTMHDVKAQKSVAESLKHKVAWSAAHIGSNGQKNWLEVVTAQGGEPEKHA